jgi:hypothetical protein
MDVPLSGAPRVACGVRVVCLLGEALGQGGASDVDGLLLRSALAGSEMSAELLGAEFGLQTVPQGTEFSGHESGLFDVRALVGGGGRADEHGGGRAVGDHRRGELQRPEVGVVGPVDAGLGQGFEQMPGGGVRVSEIAFGDTEQDAAVDDAGSDGQFLVALARLDQMGSGGFRLAQCEQCATEPTHRDRDRVGVVGTPRLCEGLAVVVCCLFELALVVTTLRQRAQRQADPVGPGAAQLDDRFGEDALAGAVPAHLEVPVAQVVEGSAETLGIAQPSADLDLSLQRPDRAVGLTHDAQQTPVAVQCVCEHLIGEIGFEVEQVVAPLESLAVLA